MKRIVIVGASLSWMIIPTIVILFFVIIAMLFGSVTSNPIVGVDPNRVGMYMVEARKYNIDWLRLAYYDLLTQESQATKRELQLAAMELSNYKASGISEDKAFEKVLASELKGSEVSDLVRGFESHYFNLLFNHRFPISVNRDHYVLQETYGVVKKGLWTKPHNGVDIAANKNVELYAVAPSKVIKMSDSGNGGISITLQDLQDPDLLYYYAHLDHYGNYRVGDVVNFDAIIGYVGATGHVTGDHLHFMMFNKDKHFDPTWFLSSWESLDKFYLQYDIDTWDQRDPYMDLAAERRAEEERRKKEEEERKRREEEERANNPGPIIGPILNQ